MAYIKRLVEDGLIARTTVNLELREGCIVEQVMIITNPLCRQDFQCSHTAKADKDKRFSFTFCKNILLFIFPLNFSYCLMHF
jgi:hypothetical protein